MCVRAPSKSNSFYLYPGGHIYLHPQKPKMAEFCCYFWRHTLVLSLLLDWSPGKTVTWVWLGEVVGIDSWFNLSNFPHCPRCVTVMYKRGDIPVNVLISTPWLQSVQTTNVALLSCMCIWYNYYYYCYYLRNILERERYCKREGGCEIHHQDSMLWPFSVKAIRWISLWGHVFSFVAVNVGLHLWRVHFLFFILVLCFL